MNVIGITGRAGTGKDTVADVLVREHGFVKVSFADPLKRMCRDVFNFTDEQLWGPSQKRNEVDARFTGVPHRWGAVISGCVACARCGFYGIALLSGEGKDAPASCVLSPRYALQRLGTEWGRDCYPDVWVEYAMRVARALLAGVGYGYDARRGLVLHGGAPARGVVIPDVRFPNEVGAIAKAGGKVWKTTRGAGLAGVSGAHASEQHVDAIEPDVTFPPDMILESLPGEVRFALGQEGRK